MLLLCNSSGAGAGYMAGDVLCMTKREYIISALEEEYVDDMMDLFIILVCASDVCLPARQPLSVCHCPLCSCLFECHSILSL